MGFCEGLNEHPFQLLRWWHVPKGPGEDRIEDMETSGEVVAAPGVFTGTPLAPPTPLPSLVLSARCSHAWTVVLFVPGDPQSQAGRVK